MFQTNSYLQYKNTPDGKPRLLREGVDYNLKSQNYFWIDDAEEYSEEECYIDSYFTKVKLLDCRLLLSVEVEGDWFTELDIYSDSDLYEIQIFRFKPDSYSTLNVIATPAFKRPKKLGSFFDNPAKYSEMLWNCSEEEGWQKVLELLEIK